MQKVRNDFLGGNMLRKTSRKRGNAFLVNIDIIDGELDELDWETIKGEYERKDGQTKGKNIQKDK